MCYLVSNISIIEDTKSVLQYFSNFISRQEIDQKLNYFAFKTFFAFA